MPSVAHYFMSLIPVVIGSLYHALAVAGESAAPMEFLLDQGYWTCPLRLPSVSLNGAIGPPPPGP